MRFWITSLLLLSTWASVFALDASLSFARFTGPQGTYLELYLHVAGSTVEPVAVNDSIVQGAVDVLVFFEQGEQLVRYDI